MNKKVYTTISLVFLIVFVVSATFFVAKAAFPLNLNPLSGEPGDTIGVSSSTGDFEPLTSVGIGFGAEVAVTGASIEQTVSGGGPYTYSGIIPNRPIKPGSFTMIETNDFTEVEFWDNGDGTFNCASEYFISGTINYTSGHFSRDATIDATEYIQGHSVNYTTYEVDVTPEYGATTTASGFISESITVPSVANGSYTVTAIDEMGNVGTGNFQVVGSEVIPEPLTVTALILLSSTSAIVSFYWMRKRSYNKNIA